MFATHYPSLLGAYVAALAAWWLVRRFARIWPASPAAQYQHRLREFGYALLGGVGVIGVGMLWSRGIRLPEEGMLRPVLASLNQIAIYAPILLIPVIRRHGRDSAWLGGTRVGHRIAAGVLLSVIAVLAYSYLRAGAAPFWAILPRMFNYGQLDKLVQVLCEDLAIAIVVSRLAARVGDTWASVGVAALFAAGHVPALLSGGASVGELGSLVADFALGVGILLALTKSRDVLWFWPIHFVLDMSQFDRVILGR